MLRNVTARYRKSNSYTLHSQLAKRQQASFHQQANPISLSLCQKSSKLKHKSLD